MGSGTSSKDKKSGLLNNGSTPSHEISFGEVASGLAIVTGGSVFGAYLKTFSSTFTFTVLAIGVIVCLFFSTGIRKNWKIVACVILFILPLTFVRFDVGHVLQSEPDNQTNQTNATSKTFPPSLIHKNNTSELRDIVSQGNAAIATKNTQEELETYTNSIGMEFVLIPTGEFSMGSSSPESVSWDYESPIHKVSIAQSYYISKYEVTQKQWVEIMGNNPSFYKGDNNPVECVSWNDVQEFVSRLNENEGTDKYRLPSEAEWEYACRAGTTSKYYYGNNPMNLDEYAWYSDNSASQTHPVGQKKPNAWGLYDMHGNVQELVQDKWHFGYENAPIDGSIWEDGNNSDRVYRGGDYFLADGSCRSACRSYMCPDCVTTCVGFRLVMEV